MFSSLITKKTPKAPHYWSSVRGIHLSSVNFPYERPTIWKAFPCTILYQHWWRHQMETFSALLALCVGNSPVTGEFPLQRPVTRNFDVFFDLRLNKRLSKQSWGWWFETASTSLWRHCKGSLIFAFRVPTVPGFMVWGELDPRELFPSWIQLRRFHQLLWKSQRYVHQCLLGWKVRTYIKAYPRFDKMAAISPFSDAFSWMKSFVSWLRFHWSLFVRA